MCTEARTSKEDNETDDDLQQSGKARREGWMTEEMLEKLALALDMIGQEVTIQIISGQHNWRTDHAGIYRWSIQTTTFL